ncbi:MAG TPA: molybdate ABC transporter permease subunit, partial [Clostridia bacterium]|nr:molybdate ABC transporter permease subunit [Clostridia bacterium]
MGTDISPLIVSLKTVLLSTLITFIIGLLAAYFMANYRGRLKGLIDGILLLPLVLPPTVVGFLLLVLFGRRGPLGSFFYKMGIMIVFSWPATVIAAVVVAFPMMYKTSKGAFEQLDDNLINAARTLGVSGVRIFLRISIPLAWPGIMAGGILAFARALGEFGATIMLAGNIPGRTQTIPLAIYFAVEGGDERSAYLWVALIIAISLAAVFVMNFWLEHQQKF